MELGRQQGNTSSVKITLEISQETNLNELMGQLCVMQGSMPARSKVPLLPDFSVHEGELEMDQDNSHRALL